MEVTLAVNEKSLIKGLRHSFTTRDTLFKELLQNADRAGATRVDITMTAEGDSTVCIEVADDGCGIDDMGALLTVATSGWSDEIVNERLPYGMGFLSAVYGAKAIDVTSRGKTMAFRCEDVLNFRPAKVDDDVTSRGLPGSRIILRGVQMTLQEARKSIERHVQGFPLPVLLNGDSLPRRHALSDAYSPSAIGHILFEGMPHGRPGRGLVLYLQGFLVYLSSDRGGNNTIVHLDPRRFIARLPDRDRLIDEGLRLEEVNAEIERLWQVHLREMRQSMSDADFLDKYHEAILMYDRRLLNSIDLIPARLCSSIAMPTLTEEWRWEARDGVHQQHIARADVESRTHRFARGGFPDQDSLPAWMFAHRAGYILIDVSRLDPEHWVHAQVVDLDRLRVEITATDRSVEGVFSGTSCFGDVVICESYRLRASNDEDVEIGHVDIDDVAMYDPREAEDVDVKIAATSLTFFVPRYGAEHFRSTVQQASTFHDEWHFREDWVDEDEAAFARKVHELRGAHPSDVLLSLLNGCADIRDYPSLHGRRFLLTIGSDGRIESTGEVTVSDRPTI